MELIIKTLLDVHQITPRALLSLAYSLSVSPSDVWVSRYSVVFMPGRPLRAVTCAHGVFVLWTTRSSARTAQSAEFIWLHLLPCTCGCPFSSAPQLTCPIKTTSALNAHFLCPEFSSCKGPTLAKGQQYSFIIMYKCQPFPESLVLFLLFHESYFHM